MKIRPILAYCRSKATAVPKFFDKNFAKTFGFELRIFDCELGGGGGLKKIS